MSQEGLPTSPIKTLVLDDFDEQYFEVVQKWLNSLGCAFARENGVYRVHFPEGTIEQVALGVSTPWNYITKLQIPGATEHITRVRARMPSTGETRSSIGVPKELLQDLS